MNMTNQPTTTNPPTKVYVLRSRVTGLYYDGKTGCNEHNLLNAKRLDQIGAVFVKAQYDNVEVVEFKAENPITNQTTTQKMNNHTTTTATATTLILDWPDFAASTRPATLRDDQGRVIDDWAFDGPAIKALGKSYWPDEGPLSEGLNYFSEMTPVDWDKPSQTLTADGVLLDSQSHLIRRGVTVEILVDAVRVDSTLYPLHEVEITSETVSHIGGAWYVLL